MSEERPMNVTKKREAPLMQLIWQVLLLGNKQYLVLFKHVFGLSCGYSLHFR